MEVECVLLFEIVLLELLEEFIAIVLTNNIIKLEITMYVKCVNTKSLVVAKMVSVLRSYAIDLSFVSVSY